MQRINPVLHIQDSSRVAHANGRFLHRLSDIGKTRFLRSHALVAKQARKHLYHFVWGKGTSGKLFARIDGNIHHGLTLLQEFLTTGDILHKTLCLREPGLVALEEESDAIQRHSRLLVHPRVMGVHVEEETIHAQCKVSVQQGLDHSRYLVPDTTNLRESLGLHNVLAIDVSSTDGIQHIVGFVVGRRVQPEFAHRNIHVAIV